MARMRMAKGVLEAIKEQDPGTQVTLHYIRAIINSGKVPVARSGAKKLVDVDEVIRYITEGETVASTSDRLEDEADDEPPKIRRVEV